MEQDNFVENNSPVLKQSSLQQRLKLVDPLLMLLVIVFASSAWIGPIAVEVELPKMVHNLPEGWTLPSYITIIMQCAVFAPVVYAVVNKLCPGDVYKREVTLSFVIMGVTVTGLLALAACWYSTVWIAGTNISLFLFLLVVYLSAVSNLSTIVYVPYMATFKDYYMPAFTAGEDMGGLVMGVIGLIQGGSGQSRCTTIINDSLVLLNITNSSMDMDIMNANTTTNFTHDLVLNQNEPKFSVTIFFIIASLFSALSIVSFLLMNFTTRCRKEMIRNINLESADARNIELGSMELTNKLHNSVEHSSEDSKGKLLDKKFHKEGEECRDCDNKRDRTLDNGARDMSYFPIRHTERMVSISEKQAINMKKMPTKRRVVCFVCITLLSFIMLGVYPSVQSYATLPYGTMVYNFAVCLNLAINPLVCLSTLFIRMRSLYIIVLLVIANAAIFGFQIFLASTSPEPPLHGTWSGALMAIVTNVLMGILLSFTRASIANILCTEGGHDDLFTCGVCYQAGALVGSVIAFIMVTVLQLFEESTAVLPCEIRS